MPVLLSILGFGKSAVGSLFKWLGSLSLPEFLLVVVGLYAALLTLVYRAEKRHEAKVVAQYEKRISALNAEIVSITSAKNEQKVITHENIRVVTKVVHDADQRAKVVENAPPAPDCHHDTSMLGADL